MNCKGASSRLWAAWWAVAWVMSLFATARCLSDELPTGIGKDPRVPVPDAAAIAEAETLVEEAFADDLKAAKDYPLALVKKFAAAATASRDAARRYALMQQAERLAIAGGDQGLAMQLVIERGRAFEIDTMTELLITLKRLADAQEEQSQRLLPLAQGLALDAAAVERFDLAIQAVNLAKEIAQSLSQRERKAAAARRQASRGLARPEPQMAPAMLKEVEDVRTTVIARQKAYEKYQQAREILRADPTSAAGHLGVGAYLCFEANDWEKGLPSLAQADGGEISNVAASEIAAGGSPDASVVYQVAGKWWTAAEANGLPAVHALAIRDHAARLYGSVARKLDDPVENALAETRAREGRRTPSANTSVVSGARP